MVELIKFIGIVFSGYFDLMRIPLGDLGISMSILFIVGCLASFVAWLVWEVF